MKNLFLLFMIVCISHLNAEESPNSIQRSKNTYALEFANQLLNEGKEEFFISPYNISSAFALVHVGANGKTAEQLQKFFAFTEGANTNFFEYIALGEFLEQTPSYWEWIKEKIPFFSKTTPSTKLYTANSIWVDQSIRVLDDFRETLEYDAHFFERDFIRQSEAARQEINRWVEDHTENKIRDLLPSLDPSTVAIIVSTLYFKGDWKHSFDKKNTREEIFYKSNGKPIQSAMMYHELTHRLFLNDEVAILELPYYQVKEEGKPNPEIVMQVILPHKKNRLHELMESMTWEKLQEWSGQMDSQKVKVYLPKFKIESQFSLEEPFADLGLNLPFSQSEAEFDGIAENKNFFIDQVIHKTWIQVDEEGTEAAAATGVIMVTRSTGANRDFAYEFRADHPFLFLVLEKQAGVLIGLGIVSSP